MSNTHDVETINAILKTSTEEFIVLHIKNKVFQVKKFIFRSPVVRDYFDK